VRSSCSKVRLARTREDTKVSVGRRGTEESMVRSWSGRSCGRKTVKKVGDGVKALCPEAREQGGWIRRVRMTVFVVRIMRSTLSFCGEGEG
jgi:hypothetical protein